jgi:hypothetical protein
MKTIPLLAAAFAVLCSSVYGQVLTQTQTFSGLPNFSAPLLFNQYNGNPADLQNVNISYSITISGGQFIVDNDSQVTAITTATFGASLYATSSDVILADNAFQQIIQGASAVNSQLFILGPDNGDGVNNYDSSGPDGGILVGTTKTETGNGDVNSLGYGGYIGAGQFTINALTNQVGYLSYNSGIETATTPVNVSGSITVTYEAVPETSSAALLGLAAIGLAFRRRRA